MTSYSDISKSSRCFVLIFLLSFPFGFFSILRIWGPLNFGCCVVGYVTCRCSVWSVRSVRIKPEPGRVKLVVVSNMFVEFYCCIDSDVNPPMSSWLTFTKGVMLTHACLLRLAAELHASSKHRYYQKQALVWWNMPPMPDWCWLFFICCTQFELSSFCSHLSLLICSF